MLNKTSILLALVLSLLSTSLLLAQPSPCEGAPAMELTCADACVICDIDGFTGRNDQSVPGQFFQGFCTTFNHNMSYIAFIAGSTNLTVRVTVTNCSINWGLEIGMFKSDDCLNFEPITECNTDVPPNGSWVFSNDVPLVIGQHYYLIMDGSAGDICDWSFEVLSGSTAVNSLTTSGEILGNRETCPGLATRYAATGEEGAALFYWTINGVSQAGTDQIQNFIFDDDGVYTICATAANACDEAPPTCTEVVVRTIGTLQIDTSLCASECLEIDGRTLCDTDLYEWIYPLDNGCDSTIIVDLEILPQSIDNVDINICAGTAFFIGDTPYTETGIYQGSVLNDMECDSIVNLDLFVIECEIIGDIYSEDVICNGEATGTIIFSVENGTPSFDYDWSNIVDASIGGTGSTNLFDNNRIENVPFGTYEINIRDTFFNATVLFVDVLQPPPISMDFIPSDYNGYNISCNGGDDGIITAVPSGGVPPYSYVWENGITQAETTNLPAGYHEVELTDDAGCIMTFGFTLNQPDTILADVLFTDPNCDGLNTGIMELLDVSGGVGPYTYSNDNQVFGLDSLYNNLNPGLQELSIQDANGCIVSYAQELFAAEIPIITMDETIEIELGDSITITPTLNDISIDAIDWQLDPDLSCTDCLEPTVFPLNDNQYVISVVSSDACLRMDTISITVDKIRDVYIPNAFDPTSFYNGRFTVFGNKAVENVSSMQVFDRWGALVFADKNFPDSNLDYGWDGKKDNNWVTNGVYTYMIEVAYIDGFKESRVGHITLIR